MMMPMEGSGGTGSGGGGKGKSGGGGKRPRSGRGRKKDERPSLAPETKKAAQAGPEGISKSEVAALLSGVEEFSRKLESSRRVLESLASQLGALVRLSCRSAGKPESLVPHLVEMHNQLSSVHHSLEDSFEGVRTRYAELREKSSAITGGCSRDLEARRRLFGALGKRIEGAGGEPRALLRCLKEENALFSSALESYAAVLGAVSAMREVELRVNEVFNEFSEAIGRIDGLSRTMGEFLSHDDTRAFEEELESLHRHREERVGRYIR